MCVCVNVMWYVNVHLCMCMVWCVCSACNVCVHVWCMCGVCVHTVRVRWYVNVLCMCAYLCVKYGVVCVYICVYVCVCPHV